VASPLLFFSEQVVTTAQYVLKSGVTVGLPHNASVRVAVPDGCGAVLATQPAMVAAWVEYGPAPGVLTLLTSPPTSSSSIFGDFYVQPSSSQTFLQVGATTGCAWLRACEACERVCCRWMCSSWPPRRSAVDCRVCMFLC
jgi:hypothetical protein